MNVSYYCRIASLVGFALASIFAFLPGTAWAQDAYGTITGQFVLEGEIPEPTAEVKKGDPSVRDASVCAAQTLYDNSLLVDEESKGIANIFVFVPRASNVHPDLASTPTNQQEIVFDQKNCRFIPHSLVVRTDQTVVVKSQDPIAHNTHTFPIANAPKNFVLAPNDREGVEIQYPIPEPLPIPVKCDIHPWMGANWLIINHPYAAVTDEQGKFTIEKLPVGEHSFRVWHERVGWINRAYNVNVGEGVNELQPVAVPVARFTEQ